MCIKKQASLHNKQGPRWLYSNICKRFVTMIKILFIHDVLAIKHLYKTLIHFSGVLGLELLEIFSGQ